MQRLTWLRAQWDRVAAGAAVAAGLLALLLGWLGARDTAYPAEQIPYVISGAVLGVILVGIGATAWLSADLRDEWRKLDRVEEILLTAATPSVEVNLAPGPSGPDLVGTAVGGDHR